MEVFIDSDRVSRQGWRERVGEERVRVRVRESERERALEAPIQRSRSKVCSAPATWMPHSVLVDPSLFTRPTKLCREKEREGEREGERGREREREGESVSHT
jgi:hypothetical protein